MPVVKSPVSSCSAVALARRGDQSIGKIARDVGNSESCLRRWMNVDDGAGGRRGDTTSAEPAELLELRRRNRVLEMEVEIVTRAWAYFARENVLPRLRAGGSVTLPRTNSPSR